ncbi:IS30 family transposase [Candidatus Peregrinibacteria bacterium]|nr:IS30 family transposase [Candidatus Peregrinibacteria bacterium]
MAHLTLTQRELLYTLHWKRRTQEEIADALGCSQSTVSRELVRNKAGPRLRYLPDRADEIARERRVTAKADGVRWFDHAMLFAYVRAKLELKWSPQQIAGRIKRDFPRNGAMRVSHFSIYAYLWNDRWSGGELYKHLRNRGRKRKWYGMADGRRQITIPNRRSIDERPKIVDAKKRYGDWESDLVVGNGAIATFVERKSKLLRAALLPDQTALEMTKGARKAFSDIPSAWRRTMTHDNGREIADHETITKDLSLIVYCAHPYRSCERGLNENTNGLLRQFFPKKTDFQTITHEQVAFAVDLLNNRPRRTLKYRTPNEIFQKYITQHYAFQVLM